MSWKDRKDLLRRSKAELIEMILNRNTLSDEVQSETRVFDWKKYSFHHVAFKFFYLGWDMHGLSQQPDRLNTIEEHLFRALLTAKLIPPRPKEENKFGLASEVNYQRCGRTDVGVSAFSQVVSLRVRSLKPKQDGDDGIISLPSYIHKINSLLPPEIKIYAAAEVPEDFSARFSCTERQYKYFFAQQNLSIEKMKEAALLLVGEHDFRNFCKIDAANIVSFVREIRSVAIEVIQGSTEPQNTLLAFVIRGSGFLWHQVRCIVAILFMIGRGDEEISIVSRLLNVEEQPCKPTYNLASELPLVLWDCSFPGDIQFTYDNSVIQRVREGLELQWNDVITKCAITRHMLDSLQSHSPQDSVPSRKRKYKALLDRPVGPSLDYLVANLSGRKREMYNAKKQKLEEYENKQN